MPLMSVCQVTLAAEEADAAAARATNAARSSHGLLESAQVIVCGCCSFCDCSFSFVFRRAPIAELQIDLLYSFLLPLSHFLLFFHFPLAHTVEKVRALVREAIGLMAASNSSDDAAKWAPLPLVSIAVLNGQKVSHATWAF